ncbi:TIGR03086 family metal-binding protein [Pseudonocardia sp. TRM90224]|uniref:TIGR03086 family metal-binding protein n=1 Tax=Pseudonocardia sp. TRM90224 TaxID=2812678 RepID=UPI001E5EDAEA|nr:TIGR03086 family metal-binding protein [Pseudonocardia sp. TRM90224]
MTLDSLTALDSAVTAFRRHLAFVAEDDWAAATPCPGWDVHYLVAHVVGGNRFACMVLDGQTAEQAMTAVMSARQLSADPTADFDDSVAAQRVGFCREGALAQIVGHPLGDLPGRRFLDIRVFDIAVHSWDLAVAIGRDGTLDEALTDSVLTIVTGEAPGMGFGIQPLGEASPDADPMDQLLDLAGRSALPR